MKKRKLVIKPYRIRRYPEEVVKKYKGRVPEKVKKQIAEVRKLKRIVKKKRQAFSRKYNRQLEKVMKERGYFPDEIAKAKQYTLTGKAIKVAVSTIPVTKISVAKNKYYIKGKGWIPKTRFKQKVAGLKYWAVVKHYKNLYNVSLKEARDLYKSLRGEFGEYIRKAIY